MQRRTGVARIEPPETGVSMPISDSASNDLARPVNYFMVDADGDVVVVWRNDTESTYYGCKAGTIYPGFIKRIKATGTTASNATGFYAPE